MNQFSPPDLEAIARDLRALTEPAVSAPPAPGKWSAKQVLGHLLDSAVNNHVRFVRAQAEDPLFLPGYDQEHWNRAQRYGEAQWDALVDLWLAYNLNLRRVLQHVPQAAWHHRIGIGDHELVTLEFVAQDYYRHLEHHLRQIHAAVQRAPVDATASGH